MIVDIYPSKVDGMIAPPPSKSFLHRAIISASLAEGTSTINRVVYNEDVLATIGAFETLGVQIDKQEDRLIITSSGHLIFSDNIQIDCHESGSTIRFLIPILSNNMKVLFTGNSSLFKRPFNVYENLYRERGLVFETYEKSILTQGRLSPGVYEVSGSISSQFISGLLFALPLMNGDSVIRVSGNFESVDYVNLTLEVLRRFGINIIKNGNQFFVKGNQKYIPTNIDAETDLSQAAFFAVLGIVNSDIKIEGVNSESIQPDRAILSYISTMGGYLNIEDNQICIKKSETRGIDIDISQSPDIGPIIALLCAKSKGTSNIYNAKRLRMKESDRLLSTYETLKRFGVNVSVTEDSLTIHGVSEFQGGTFDSFNDHRMAMMIAIGATVANSKVTILNAEAVNKSYPHFYKDLQSLGAEIKYR